MSMSSILGRFFSGLWRLITWLRLALANILFLLLLLMVYLLFRGSAPQPLPEQAALLLNPVGQVVEQRQPVNPVEALTGQPAPASHEVVLQDILDTIKLAAADPAINSLVLELDDLMGVGSSKAWEIGLALEAFRERGKPIIARGDYFSQDQYLLASRADTVILHPLGGVALEGFSSYRNYYREALNKLSVNVHVFRAGEHKSIAEPFLRNDMSPGEREITQRWLDQLWEQVTGQLEQRRELAEGAVDAYINQYDQRLAAHEGNPARAALAAGLVDELLTHIEANEHIANIVGARNEEGLYEAVPFEQYLSRKRSPPHFGHSGERVAVIVAEGNIVPGEQPPGTIGGDSLARLIRDAAERDGVAALVLRVNSGGGSVFASEVIRQALLSVQARGLPLVVSMGSVAASGGYYIAASADRIFATPSTITGSIGVFAAFPTFEDLMSRAGVYTDGVGTTDLAGSLRVDRPLNPTLSSALTRSVEYSYRNFLELVAQGRELTLEQVDAVAQGRVWSAQDARRQGLVDELGSLDDAIAAAGELAGLDDPAVEYVRPHLTPRELFLQELTRRAELLPGLRRSAPAGAVELLLQPVIQATQLLESLDDPGHLYMRCLACGPSL